MTTALGVHGINEPSFHNYLRKSISIALVYEVQFQKQDKKLNPTGDDYLLGNFIDPESHVPKNL